MYRERRGAPKEGADSWREGGCAEVKEKPHLPLETYAKSQTARDKKPGRQSRKIGVDFWPQGVEETKIGVWNLSRGEAPVSTPGSHGTPGSHSTKEEQTNRRHKVNTSTQPGVRSVAKETKAIRPISDSTPGICMEFIQVCLLPCSGPPTYPFHHPSSGPPTWPYQPTQYFHVAGRSLMLPIAR